MKNNFLNTARVLSLLTLTAGLSACETVECPDCLDNAGAPASLTLSINPAATKSTEIPSEETDNAVGTVDVFVFNTPGASVQGHGELDTYRRFENSSEPIEIQTTTGAKKICVVVNSKSGDLTSVTSLSQLQQAVTRLQDETFGNLTMYGEKDVTLSAENTVDITVSRFISRITVSSIKTKFNGTPYEGVALTNTKLYLINAHGDKILFNGGATTVPTVLNAGTLNTDDVEGCAQSGLLYDEISAQILDEGYSTSHHLYTYANETNDIETCTKLVMETEINGSKYYYPIPVNQEGYGYTSENGHYGIKRNTVYSFGITISRPGSLDPDEPVETGAVEISINVEDWAETPSFEKEF
ncbi:MAG TPA: hypothetical protein IAC04_07430 [Candidatus Coprenecus stercoravium]|uniref:Major fimbrial subunit protein N-terminal domain-containing protein n=1 Tax=Candidatus Coprenecus stercoravium TaxID=2840735 RepID=A0A9D2GQF4_9BACT|nr:hypothetical protein [Candidatus Coprenecus stercoravium]